MSLAPVLQALHKVCYIFAFQRSLKTKMPGLDHSIDFLGDSVPIS